MIHITAETGKCPTFIMPPFPHKFSSIILLTIESSIVVMVPLSRSL